MDMMGWVLVGAFLFFAIALLLVVIYLIWKRGAGSVKFEKRIVDGKSVATVQPFINLKRAMVQDKAEGQNIVFVRENIASGEKVVFEYPASNTPARLTTEGELNITIEAKP